MPDDVNKVRNADFSVGRSTPRNWVFKATPKQSHWHRPDAAKAQETPGVTVVSEHDGGTAGFSQVVICKPGEFYRVEATITCDLDGPDESAGLVLQLQPYKNERPVGRLLKTPGLNCASEPIAIRAYYQAPEDVRRLELSVSVVRARGSATIRGVRFIRILEPEEDSHVLAIPAPSYSSVPPLIARKVCVCSDQADARPITALLSGYFGDRHVQALGPGELSLTTLKADALLLPDPTPPPPVRSLATLSKLAGDRIVVISLPAFARLSNSMLSLKRVEQDDDPIHAKVVYANHATHSFALHDVFAYAWPGRSVGSFVQNQYRKTLALRSFCAKHRLTSLLFSVCDQDATSDRPICLHMPTKSGGVYVLDIEPAEATGSTRAEPALAFHLLLSILGHTQASLGQYMVAVSDEADLRGHVRDMTERFDRFKVHEEDVPIDEATEQLVTVNPPPSQPDIAAGASVISTPAQRVRCGAAFDPTPGPLPVILVRTALTGGDIEGLYGAWIWFKQLVRMGPFTCPYAEELAAQFRLAWVPLVAQWESAYGWRRSGSSPTHPMAVATDDAEIAAMIDIVACPVNRVRVVFPGEAEGYGRYAAWLPRLAEAFPPGRYFHPTVDQGEGFCNRDRYDWRHVRHHVSVVADDAVFNDPAHHDVLATGGETIRIEVPSCDADYTARSIQSTDLVATLLEHVVGLQYGLLAVNRGPAPVQLGALPPTDPGQALIVHQSDPILRVSAARTG